MEFNQKSGVSSPMDLIPRGYLCWAKVTMRGMKTSTTTGSRYAEVELTVADNQPFQRKKIFTKIGDPDYKENSEKYREMGMVSLTRMVEAAQIVNPEDAASYEKLNGKSCEAILIMLDGKYVAIKVKVEPGSQGYEDKNDVGEYLTPNAQSGSHKNYVKLTNGDHGSVDEQKKGGGFGGVPATTPTAPRPSGFQGGQAESVPAQTAQPPAEARGFNPNQAPAYLR